VGHLSAIGATPAERTALTAADLAAAFKLAAASDIGIQPEGDLFESFRTPTVTRFQVHAIIPFHDNVWKVEVTGAKLKDLLAKSSPLAGVMHATIAAADIDPAKTYTAATTDFVAQLALGGGTDTGVDARTATETWLKAGAPGAAQPAAAP
jgi:2',3'-cyclic-nucleotide 2'-phosphodiesterase (5'-nucleotidase family)